MTVRATDIAFCDFEKNSIPWLIHSEANHVVAFLRRITMVEVEHDNVCLSAIDARMSSKILTNEWTVLVAVATAPRDFLPNIGVPIAEVVLTSVLRVTCTTATLASAFALIRERKGVDGLESPAVVTPLCLARRRQS